MSLPFPALSRRARKVWLVVHVVSSVGWLGLTLCLLTLGLAALFTADAATVRAAYGAGRLLGDLLVPPLSLTALVSGVVLGLGTRWGLLRHRWVAVKFWLTLAAVAASLFALPIRLHEAARLAARPGPIAAMHLGFVRYDMVLIPSIALTVYTTATALSVVKPWTRRRGRQVPAGGEY